MLIDTEMHLLANLLEKLLEVYQMKLEEMWNWKKDSWMYDKVQLCPDRKESEMSRCCYLKIGLIFPNFRCL